MNWGDLVILWCLGFWCGFGFRVWGERRASRHDSPAWITRLGYSLVAQFAKVDEGHKFAGDEVKITSELSYAGGGKQFVVRVERETTAAEIK